MAKKYKTIDLFAGIGGFRIAFEKEGYETVYSNEIDKHCCKIYEDNFGDNPCGDITQVNAKEIPDFNVLLAGFPCQSFSIAGERKGFDDTRGTLFFDIARILKEKRPEAFLLENVKHLAKHDKGKTLKVILDTLRKDLGYDVIYYILNASHFGLPQKRERIFIVGFRKDLGINFFEFPLGKKTHKTIKDIMEKNVPAKYFLTQKMLNCLENHTKRHAEKGNGFGHIVLNPNDLANTIVCGGMGRERNLVIDKEGYSKLSKNELKDRNTKAIRYLTPREYARLQGYPENFKITVSDTQAYKQFANSIPVPVVQNLARLIMQKLKSAETVKCPQT